MRVRRTGEPDAALDTALGEQGLTLVEDGSATLLHVVAPTSDLDDVTETLTSWVREARATVGAGGDVIAVVDQAGFDGAEVAAAMIAHGMVAGVRALAMEQARDGTRANLVVRGDVHARDVAATVAWLASVPSATGQVVHVGGAMHGRQRP